MECSDWLVCLARGEDDESAHSTWNMFLRGGEGRLESEK